MANVVGSLGTIPTLVVGGYTFATFTNFKQIVASCYGNKYSTFRAFPATAYQVPSAKLFKCKAMLCVSAGDAATYTGVCYGDNDVGTASVSAPTSAVNLHSSGAGLAQVHIVTGANIRVEIPLQFDFPALKYPALNLTNNVANCGATSHLFGYEEA